jgi:hypothetical protein
MILSYFLNLEPIIKNDMRHLKHDAVSHRLTPHSKKQISLTQSHAEAGLPRGTSTTNTISSGRFERCPYALFSVSPYISKPKQYLNSK